MGGSTRLVAVRADCWSVYGAFQFARHSFYVDTSPGERLVDGLVLDTSVKPNQQDRSAPARSSQSPCLSLSSLTTQEPPGDSVGNV